MWRLTALILFLSFQIGCATSGAGQTANDNRAAAPSKIPVSTVPNTGKVVHVVVALCDNESQGIVPVPARIGNGDDPKNNLYWGAAYGVKTFFRKQAAWEFVSETKNPKTNVLERVVFKHKTKDIHLVADAYRGREIKSSIEDFLAFSAGAGAAETIAVGGQKTVNIAGAADLLVYVGHDGLMDFELAEFPRHADKKRREAIVLACVSKSYFAEPLRTAGAKPLLWTTGLMAPEAYILAAALDGWTTNESDEQIRQRAAEAYNKYQKCGLRAARNLLVSN